MIQTGGRRFLRGFAMAALGQLLPAQLHSAEGSRVPLFTDVTAEAGIAWQHFNGVSPDRYLLETMGGGVGFFDYDGDGQLDIFLLNGGETPRGKSEKPIVNALYHNLGNGKFADVDRDACIRQVH